VNIKDDTIDEDDEVFAVNLKLAIEDLADARANLVTEQLIVTIVDNDALPIITLNSVDQIITRDENVGAIAIELQMPYSQSGEDVEIPISWTYPGANPATPDEDFVAVSSVIYPGAANINRDLRTHTFNILIQDDAVKEDTETFYFSLQNPLNGLATLDGEGSITLTVHIVDDDARGGINDTQITTCANDTQPSMDCPSVAQDFPGQDGLSNVQFDDHFIRIDSFGDDIVTGTAACIKDTRTGLLWEVKTVGDSSDHRNQFNRYAWYNTLSNANGGDSGIAGDTNSCQQSLEHCSSNLYIEQLNASGLCGNEKWRLPKVHELVSIMSFKTFEDPNNPLMIDQDFFPNTREGFYWTASPASEFPSQAWAVYFGETPSIQPGTEFTVPYSKREHLFIRAVANSN
jgi:hypothetical protein